MFPFKKSNKYNTFDYEKKYKKNIDSSNIINLSKKYKTPILLQLSLKFL